MSNSGNACFGSRIKRMLFVSANRSEKKSRFRLPWSALRLGGSTVPSYSRSSDHFRLPRTRQPADCERPNGENGVTTPRSLRKDAAYLSKADKQPVFHPESNGERLDESTLSEGSEVKSAQASLKVSRSSLRLLMERAMTIEEQKTDLISRIGYYRQELDRLEDSRLDLGRPIR